MKKKVTLAFPPPSERYDRPWSIENINHPLSSGLAILAQNIRNHCEGIDVECIGAQKVHGETAEDFEFRYKTKEDMQASCGGSDIVGLSTILINLENSLRIAEQLKRENPHQIIVLGGPSASYSSTARLLLQQNSPIDYVVAGDGEHALVDIVRGENPADIPNLFYRDRDGKVVKSKKSSVSDLVDRPIWDFTSAPDYTQVMKAFDSRTRLYRELREKEGNFLGMVAVQFSTGCEKAEQSGPCSYCVSARNPNVVTRNAHTFWKQVLQLYDKHGITEYFIADNVLATPQKLELLLRAKEDFSIPSEIEFRVYGYVPFFYQSESKSMMTQLKDLGVKNLFVGVENFDGRVNALSNKPSFAYQQVYDIVKGATEIGIDMFLPVMAGLPGDSEESHRYNLECMERLLREFGSRTYGHGKLVRVDFSLAMPLRDTFWYQRLVRIPEVRRFYLQETGKDLPEHIDIDSDVLRDASLRYYHPKGLTNKDLKLHQQRFVEMCCHYLRPEQIGGFEPSI
ncbi:cobalamin B12-binding domain-containing protein [Candidatus Woesearchaeota archaeon]|nr:cobalamin B12-binding domain-containing protein [Candidatus Woesearchaeota archaeon]